MSCNTCTVNVNECSERNNKKGCSTGETFFEITVKTPGHQCKSKSSKDDNVTPKLNKIQKSNENTQVSKKWDQILREQNKPIVRNVVHSSHVNKQLNGANKIKDNKKYSHLECPQKQSCASSNCKKMYSVKGSFDKHEETICVTDRGTQCNNLSVDLDEDTLHLLIKKMKKSIRDEKSMKILIDMEKILANVPNKLQIMNFYELEKIQLENELETHITQLQEATLMTKKQYEMVKEQNQKQKINIEKLQENQISLKSTIKTLENELEQSRKKHEEKARIITELEEKNRKFELEFSEQSKILNQKQLEIQYLDLEKKKLSALYSYINSEWSKEKNAMKELNAIVKEFMDIKIADGFKENWNKDFSLITSGRSCSSPNTSVSNQSPESFTFQDESNVFVLTDVQKSQKNKSKISHKNRVYSSSEDTCKNPFFLNINNEDRANKEFVSMAVDESSIIPAFKETGLENSSQFALDRNSAAENDDILTPEILMPNTNQVQPVINKPISSEIKEMKNMLQEMRCQLKESIEVPSPPRHFPHSEWSDSSLPSISGISELTIQSNNTNISRK